jgi:hypothetical protein
MQSKPSHILYTKLPTRHFATRPITLTTNTPRLALATPRFYSTPSTKPSHNKMATPLQQHLVEGNAAYAADFKDGNLGLRPSKSYIIGECVGPCSRARATSVGRLHCTACVTTVTGSLLCTTPHTQLTDSHLHGLAYRRGRRLCRPSRIRAHDP